MRDQQEAGRIGHYPIRGITRRDFLAASAAGLITACATNPVTKEKQLMLVSEEGEIKLDLERSPHQFSADYGAVQDQELNSYISGVGKRMTTVTHRPQMPYSFRAVNAAYVNAYAFPGGSIAVTRGILVALSDEAELGALLGHELGHVNFRHSAQQMSKGIFAQIAIAGVAAYAGSKDARLGPLASGLGGLGVGALLARYSRDNEREADEMGMEYMTRANYSPQGMVELMEVLMGLHKSRPGAVEMMFATHPLSEERYQDAVGRVSSKYDFAKSYPMERERYMDNTAKLRKLKPAIELMNKGSQEMAAGKLDDGERDLKSALTLAPDDYAALTMMSKLQLAKKNYPEAKKYAEEAKRVYPGEAQAAHLIGMASLAKTDYAAAFDSFDAYEKALPGNPNTIFLKGLSMEGAGNKKRAAGEYARYMKVDNSSRQAQHAYGRLVDWGYIKKEEKK